MGQKYAIERARVKSGTVGEQYTGVYRYSECANVVECHTHIYVATYRIMRFHKIPKYQTRLTGTMDKGLGELSMWYL